MAPLGRNTRGSPCKGSAGPQGEALIQERILVCDDDDMTRAIIGIALEASDEFVATLCQSGSEAIEQYQLHGADLIILDVNMPDLDGPQTFQQLKSGPAPLHTPVIFLSGTDDPAEIQQLRNLGAADVLQKPFDIAEFPKRIHQIISKYQLDQVINNNAAGESGRK